MSSELFPTTHVGRLGHVDALDQSVAGSAGVRPTAEAFRTLLRTCVRDVVKRQVDCGIDIVSDGELGKLSWYTYLTSRLAGLAPAQDVDAMAEIASSPDWVAFADYYREDFLQSWMARRWAPVFSQPALACVGAIRYVGQAPLAEDIDNLKSAMAAAGVTRGFMNSVAPGSAQLPNRYYRSEEEHLFALADALHEEYGAIVAAGLILQIDDPMLVDDHGAHNDGPAGAARRAAMRVAALNHALRGIPPEKVRIHICWGSWHGPHSTDLPMRGTIPLLLKMQVGGWSVEASNARHEHEFADWKGVDLGGRVLLPGVVGHATNTVEHPDLVAWRIGLWADAVGPSSVIPSTDCGLGDRVHPQIETAKLRALAAGAAIARGRYR
jgi:5-methyltetrahydropteroyltriglutamate--homocysteine methyltransferase